MFFFFNYWNNSLSCNNLARRDHWKDLFIDPEGTVHWSYVCSGNRLDSLYSKSCIETGVLSSCFTIEIARTTFMYQNKSQTWQAHIAEYCCWPARVGTIGAFKLNASSIQPYSLHTSKKVDACYNNLSSITLTLKPEKFNLYLVESLL